MDPPPAKFNFNTATNSSGGGQNAERVTFGSKITNTAFGSSLFGKPSAFSISSKTDSEKTKEKNEPGSSNSLTGRLTMASKYKESMFKAKGDTYSNQGTVLQEGVFKINRKAAFGQLGRRRIREGTLHDNSSTSVNKNVIEQKQARPTTSLFQSMNRNEPIEIKGLFGKSQDDGVDETDSFSKRELPSQMFGVPLPGNTTIKSFGSMSNLKEKPNLVGSLLGDKPFKPMRLKERESPALEKRLPKQSGQEEGKLVQKLASLRGQICAGDYEKYIMLDERDKILCQLREIDSALIRRLERSEEMCTEKERYQRIVQKGASPFECNVETGEVAHDMMVKQYARSAADQERPLPHELRSEKIMNYTMCYLLHNILDVFPETPEQRAAWYNFLWSRTRALRKEVTQLQMSDLPALHLVERCTRLHIVFGYVLCDLETEHFDSAMNNENLGKCLQTLRHLYEDFAKRGIQCDNEPEFRSYDVMLHMNDTNVLSQVLSYRNEVRQSHHVCLALQLASAYRDKNYCRFFRLLQTQATYLQCCVSHKLFGATRSSAISIMVNSYGKNALFPLEKLKKILVFDSTEELVEILSIYGLRTEPGSDHVMFNRDYLSLNETVPTRQYKWINDKNQKKLSQAVYGPNLFQFFSSRCDISNSFNHRNEYSSDKVLEAVLDGSNIPISNDPSSFSFSQSAGSLSMQSSIEQKRKMDAERLKKIEETKKEQLVEKMLNGVVDQAVNGIIKEEIMKASMMRKKLQAMEEAKRRREEQKRLTIEMEKKKKDREREVTQWIMEHLEVEITENRLTWIVKEEMKKGREKRERFLAQKIADRFWENMLKSVDKQVMAVCLVLVNEKERMTETLEAFRNKIARQWLHQFWNRWREWVRLKKEKKAREMEMVPKCVPRWEAEEVARDLVRKYGTSEENQISTLRLLQDIPSNSIQIRMLRWKRHKRMLSAAFQQWREFSKKRKMQRILARKQEQRNNDFFKRFENPERIETRFKFDAPMDVTNVKRRKSDIQRPTLKNDIPVLSAPNTSLFVARRQLEDFETGIDMPSELKEKMKRKRESFEKARADHLTKKKKDEEFISKETRAENQQISEVWNTADKLLNETRSYTEDLDLLMAQLKARRVEDL